MRDIVGLGVGMVVEEDAAAAKAMDGPVVDAVFEVGGGALDVGARGSVVEGAGWEMGDLIRWEEV